mmetsp:Transcript_5800/g.21129  ORF Transcript_5800/g.21129 Transcript_5800/m.21129 type:complete len:211 (-) Transcript_5800:78-710(-)
MVCRCGGRCGQALPRHDRLARGAHPRLVACADPAPHARRVAVHGSSCKGESGVRRPTGGLLGLAGSGRGSGIVGPRGALAEVRALRGALDDGGWHSSRGGPHLGLHATALGDVLYNRMGAARRLVREAGAELHGATEARGRQTVHSHWLRLAILHDASRAANRATVNRYRSERRCYICSQRVSEAAGGASEETRGRVILVRVQGALIDVS